MDWGLDIGSLTTGAPIDASAVATAMANTAATDAVMSRAWIAVVANLTVVPRTSDDVERLRAASDVLGMSTGTGKYSTINSDAE